MSDLWRLTAHEAHEKLRAKEFTSVELTQSVLDRVAAVEPRVHAYITVTADLALEQAREADARFASGTATPLTGIPTAVKDLIVHKRRYSGFFGSDLEITLRELDVDSLQLIGWSTSLAVATTAIDAWQLGFPTTVVSDLTIAHAWGGHSVEENQKWSLDYIAAMAKSKLVRSDELMQ